jgi:outer membrane protein OmpA-like peptidoglycan-associated protein
MRTASLLLGVLLAGCAGQEVATSLPEPSHEPAQRSNALATLSAYAHDRDPREQGQSQYWPYNRPLDRAALALRSCAGQAGHYQLVARLSPFEHAGQTLPAVVRDELAALAQALLSHASAVNVLVTGHTDAAGSAPYNQRLSERRARSVARELVRQGLPARQLQIVGYGEHAPLHPLLLSEVAPLNRRVEVFTYLPLAADVQAAAPCLQAVQPIAAQSTAAPLTAEVMK